MLQPLNPPNSLKLIGNLCISQVFQIECTWIGKLLWKRWTRALKKTLWATSNHIPLTKCLEQSLMEIIQILPRKEAFIAFLLLFKVEKERTSVQNVKVKKMVKGKLLKSQATPMSQAACPSDRRACKFFEAWASLPPEALRLATK